MQHQSDEDNKSGLSKLVEVGIPAKHIDVLRETNGLEIYGGYYRLFGTGGHGIDALCWNDPETWKFAWPKTDVLNYFCFGESAWGHQYAYRYSDLRKTASLAPVYELDGITMASRELERDFSFFWENEFQRIAKEPYDELTVAVRQKLGSLGALEHIAWMPSLLLGGSEDIANVVKLDAVNAMILNGDLASQLVGEDFTKAVRSIESYRDEKGRERLRVIWK